MKNTFHPKRVEYGRSGEKNSGVEIRRAETRSLDKRLEKVAFGGLLDQ